MRANIKIMDNPDPMLFDIEIYFEWDGKGEKYAKRGELRGVPKETKTESESARRYFRFVAECMDAVKYSIEDGIPCRQGRMT